MLNGQLKKSVVIESDRMKNLYMFVDDDFDARQARTQTVMRLIRMNDGN